MTANKGGLKPVTLPGTGGIDAELVSQSFGHL